MSLTWAFTFLWCAIPFSSLGKRIEIRILFAACEPTTSAYVDECTSAGSSVFLVRPGWRCLRASVARGLGVKPIFRSSALGSLVGAWSVRGS